MNATGRAELATVGRDLLGVELRAGQLDAIEACVGGADVLAVMPTGYGKSAIYQVAGSAIEGPTVVISPLIALQHDQVGHIGEQLGGAVMINSTLTPAQRADAFDLVAGGEVEFVFVAPEQLANPDALDALAAVRPSLLVVDEAHCISTLGHDFRPAYRRLGQVRDALGGPRVLALTATAAPPVRADIVEQLALDDPVVLVTGFERDNLHVAVTHVDDGELVDATAALVGALDGTGLVYVATRELTERIAELVAAPDRPGLAYHAGLKASEREVVHARFAADEPCVVVATNAFGMGIDVGHIRFVVHVGAPESLDGYVQEIGRAGRDGGPARAVLLDHPDAPGRLTGVGEIPLDEASAVIAPIAAVDGELEIAALADLVDLPETRLGQIVGLLEQHGAVDVGSDTVTWTGSLDEDEAAEEVHVSRERARSVERTRRDMVERFMTGDGCRWQTLLAYFGQPTEHACGHCDVCDGRPADADADADAEATAAPWALGDPVVHDTFGRGTVIELDGDSLSVLFNDAGYRTLSSRVLAEHGLLRAG